MKDLSLARITLARSEIRYYHSADMKINASLGLYRDALANYRLIFSISKLMVNHELAARLGKKYRLTLKCRVRISML